MKVIGSIIARQGSKRLPYKNLLPFGKTTMLELGVQKLKQSHYVDEIVVSTESELIARTVLGLGVKILQRPKELALDNVPSIPVFQHILKNFPGDIHVNLNINFALCQPEVIDRAVEIAVKNGEALSKPYAVWAQTQERLFNYGDFWKLPETFDDPRAGEIDIHTEENWLAALRIEQGPLKDWKTDDLLS